MTFGQWLDRWSPWRLRQQVSDALECSHRAHTLAVKADNEMLRMQKGYAAWLKERGCHADTVQASPERGAVLVKFDQQKIDSHYSHEIRGVRLGWSHAIGLSSVCEPELVARQIAGEAATAIETEVLRLWREQSGLIRRAA